MSTRARAPQRPGEAQHDPCARRRRSPARHRGLPRGKRARMRIGGGALRRIGGGLRRINPREADAVLALVLAALGSVDLARPVPPGSAVTPADPLGHVLVAAVCATVAVRRIVPRTALAGALLLIAVLSILGYRPSPVGLPLTVLVYTVAARYRLPLRPPAPGPAPP